MVSPSVRPRLMARTGGGLSVSQGIRSRQSTPPMINSQSDPLDLVLGKPLLGAVVELCGPRALMRGDFLGVIEGHHHWLGRPAMAVARNVWQPSGAAMPCHHGLAEALR